MEKKGGGLSDSDNKILVKKVTSSGISYNKKVLLRERKRHTACRV